MAIAEMPTEQPIPRVPGIPFLGNTLGMAKDPARFFVESYRKHGPVFRVSILGNTYTVLAGIEAANFMGSREGKECLRSKEFWQGLIDEYGASRTLTGVDGAEHAELRAVVRSGYSRESVRGRYGELTEITDRAIARDWRAGTLVPVLTAFQYMIVEQLGEILTGKAPLEYVPDIRTAILYILNILVTRQRPKILLKDPRYRRAKSRVVELGHNMIRDFEDKERAGAAPDNLIGDIMRAHRTRPDLIPRSDLVLSLTGPYVAGLDTVANTLSACVYAILKHPDVLKRVQTEADTLFAKGNVDEADIVGLADVNGAVMETMRLYPIAVAQMRTAARDFTFAGHRIREGQMLYMATSVPHFLEEYFPKPEIFDIDRYRKPRAEHMASGVYSPYGRGPHTCLGKSLAEVQMGLTVARLFHKLDLELDPPDYVLKTKTAPTPGPALSFKVKVKGLRH